MSNEVGIVLRFNGMATGLAIGSSLAPKGGYGWVMILAEDEVDRDWLGDYDILWQFKQKGDIDNILS
jgi:hypothetical protein